MKRVVLAALLLTPMLGALAAPSLAVVDDRVTEQVAAQLRGRIDEPTSNATGSWLSRAARLENRKRAVAQEGTGENESMHAVAVLQTLSTSSVALCGIGSTGFLPALQCAVDSKAPVVSISQSGLTRSLEAHMETVIALARLPLVVFSVPNRNRPDKRAGFVPEAQDMDNVVFAVSVNRQGQFEPWVMPELIPARGVVFAADGTGPGGLFGNSLATPRIAERLAELAKHNPDLAGPQLVALLKQEAHAMDGYPNVFILSDAVRQPARRRVKTSPRL